MIFYGILSLLATIVFCKFEKFTLYKSGTTKKVLILSICGVLLVLLLCLYASRDTKTSCAIWAELNLMKAGGNLYFYSKLALYTVCIATWEEIFFRKIISEGLLSWRWKKLYVALTSSLLFGLFHGSNIITAFILGLSFCVFFMRFNMLLPLILFHFTINYLTTIASLLNTVSVEGVKMANVFVGILFTGCVALPLCLFLLYRPRKEIIHR